MKDCSVIRIGEDRLQQLDDGHVYHIAYDGIHPCGYFSVQPDGVDKDGTLIYHLQKIYILPSEQGKGLGRVLFQSAVGFYMNDYIMGLDI